MHPMDSFLTKIEASVHSYPSMQELLKKTYENQLPMTILGRLFPVKLLFTDNVEINYLVIEELDK